MLDRRILALGLVSLLPAACGSTEAGESGSDAITYREHVLPIVAEHCVTCHTAGAIAPFALDEIDSARTWGAAAVAAVEARTMPPFGVNNDGSCNTFADAHWLEQDEIDTLRAWVDGGMPEGDPELPMPEPPVPDTLDLANVVEVSTPEYTPVAQTLSAEAADDYQCFIVELDQDRDRYLVGFEVVPGNDDIVHHVLGFKVNPNLFGNGDTMQVLDDASPDQLGWDCLGAAGDDVIVEGVPVTWAPGIGATLFPTGTGIPMRSDDVLVVQMHYHLGNGNALDSTQIRLAYADTVERPATQVLWDPFLYSSIFGDPTPLTPGLPSVTYSWDESFRTMTMRDDAALDLWSVLPHMHQRGRKMSIELEHAVDGSRSCAAEVDRYDFDWQRAYFYEEPLRITADDRLHVTCDWDTTADVEPVMPGFGTEAEMCLVGVYVAAPT
jgi:hypothetical protein